jgi:ADP-ribose pyrophosphatase YjhB (NUDIX family)
MTWDTISSIPVAMYPIPGGAPDVGEMIGHAVAREVKEETGIDVRPVDI